MKRVLMLVMLVAGVACAQEQRTMEISAGTPDPARAVAQIGMASALLGQPP